MTQHKQSREWSGLRTAMLALVCLSLSACALQPRVVTEYRTVYVDRYSLVPVDPELTREIPPPDRPLETWLDAVVLLIEWRQRAESYAQRMRMIRELSSD